MKNYPELNLALFRNAVIKSVAMKTYDPSMNPEELIKTTLKAKCYVDNLFDLMTDIPCYVEDYDAVANQVVTLIKNIAKTTEGE